MQPLTILYHHRTRSRDGQSVHIDELVAALRAQGHHVIMVGPERSDAMATPLESRALPQWLYEILEFGYSGLELLRLAGAVMRHRPDALYERANIYMLSGVWTARMFRLPLLLEVNSPLAEERRRHGRLAFPRVAAWTEHTVWRAATFVLPVTQVLADHVLAAGVPRARISVTPNGVDIARFSPPNAAAREALGLAAGAPVLGFTGYARPWHGLDRVIDMLAARPALARTQLLVVGDGPVIADLREQARSLGVMERVQFCGTVPRERLPAYLAAMDIALQPEVTAYASPLKLFEYMAAGLAIVAPDAANIREILADAEDALLFPQSDPRAMADAIERLVTDHALRTRLGEAARSTLIRRNLTWSGNAERVARLIQGERMAKGLATRTA